MPRNKQIEHELKEELKDIMKDVGYLHTREHLKWSYATGKITYEALRWCQNQIELINNDNKNKNGRTKFI